MMVEILNNMLFGASGAAAAKDRGTRPAELALPIGGLQSAWFDYVIDTAQRSILFGDAMRRRGNIYLEHRAQGEPPILDFAYEIVLDARTFQRPANYALLRVLPKPGMTVDPKKRPFIIVDPRAGHGPGVGGMKEDSQVGVSLRAGHPTYFVMFYPEPMPNQTLGDVAAAEARFVEEVTQLHPESEGKPCVIGNCQAGWAVMALSAVEPGLMGPVVVCGAPMSYWAGVDGKNPMRYMGGLLGGAWITSLLCDLGGGQFDGANLVANFERLNPANTLWAKPYNLYSHIDTETERFLEFERWWTGFFLLTKEEMTQIVNDLFVGNKLQRGGIRLAGGATLDLKDITAPVVVFASGGDNITPPQQALNWIVNVYGSEEEIKIHGQTIVYILHQDIGHLGIFVSGKVAQKEHYEINEAIDFIDILPPGLYEMVIEKMPAGDGDRPEDRYLSRFEPRTIADIRQLDDGQQEVEFFASSKRVSELNTRFYEAFIGPSVRMMITEPVADALREWQPLRLQYRWLSDEPTSRCHDRFRTEISPRPRRGVHHRQGCGRQSSHRRDRLAGLPAAREPTGREAARDAGPDRTGGGHRPRRGAGVHHRVVGRRLRGADRRALRAGGRRGGAGGRAPPPRDPHDHRAGRAGREDHHLRRGDRRDLPQDGVDERQVRRRHRLGHRQDLREAEDPGRRAVRVAVRRPEGVPDCRQVRRVRRDGHQRPAEARRPRRAS